MPALRAAVCACAIAGLAGCAAIPHFSSPDTAKPADALQLRAFNETWVEQRLPTKTPTEYRRVQRDGREAIVAQADGSASLMRRQLRIEPAQLGRLRLSWLVEDLIADADMGSRERDDSPVRVVLAFDGDRSRFSARDAAASELSMLMTGEPLPYATLMYVWCNQRAPGSVIDNPRTTRIRKIVLESGTAGLGRWHDYERDVRADYEKAFGEPPGALIGVGLMTDADNTRARARAWYGAPQLLTRRDTDPR
ncbi:MAG: DUF3047 domain-containing protein [Betaproteobacteria bacterium]|nr:DUF3047 domain-containing protein [Betaproteobacteria bacterium]